MNNFDAVVAGFNDSKSEHPEFCTTSPGKVPTRAPGDVYDSQNIDLLRTRSVPASLAAELLTPRRPTVDLKYALLASPMNFHKIRKKNKPFTRYHLHDKALFE